MKMITITILTVALWACTDSSTDNPQQCQNPTSVCSDNDGVRTDVQVDPSEDTDTSVVEADSFVADPETLDTIDAGESSDMGEGQILADMEGEEESDAEAFVKVSAGGYHSCALKGSGTAVCWGRNNHGQVTVPNRTFTDISTNYWHSCGVATSGEILCWGDNEFGQSDGIEGDFVQVSAGYMHTCGLLANGEVLCSGLEDIRVEPPSGPFTEINSGWYHTCALRLDQTMVCWGMNSDDQLGPIPEAQWSAVAAGGLHTCGVTQTENENAVVRCWGSNEFGQGTPDMLGGDAVANLSAGIEHNCAVFSDGTTQCWGRNNRGQSNPATSAMIEISAGLDHSCGLSLSNQVLCWGQNNHGQSDAPSAQ